MVKHGGRSADDKKKDRRRDVDAKKRISGAGSMSARSGGSMSGAGTTRSGDILAADIEADEQAKMSSASRATRDLCRSAHWSCPLCPMWHTDSYDWQWKLTPQGWLQVCQTCALLF